MKKTYLILLAAIILVSCKKNNNESGCISVVTGINEVSASDQATIQTLLDNNHLTANNQVFVFYTVVEPPTAGPVGTTYQTAESVQVRNSLEIFMSTLSYQFTNGVFKELDGRQYGKVNLDARPSLNLSILRQLYLAEISKQGIAPSFKDSCLVAQFGYFNTHFNTMDTTTNIVKAWNVHPAHSQYPTCYINDVTEATLYYDDGIRFLDTKGLKKN
jgi:hypothetical protein